MNMDWLPSSPPTSEEWSKRREKFDELWMEQIHPNGSRTNQHVDSLKLELERCFCAGAWIACIALAYSIIEVHLSHLDALRGDARQKLMASLNIENEWNSLREKRNNLIHGAGPAGDNKRIDSTTYRTQQSHLQFEAELAVELALRVALNNP
jgi:hypothetical protein